MIVPGNRIVKIKDVYTNNPVHRLSIDIQVPSKHSHSQL